MISLFAPETPRSGQSAILDEFAAQHVRARRLAVGAAVRLVDGSGNVATGTLRSVAKGKVTVDVETVVQLPRPPALDVIIPVADRDRMLWAAEKCVEFQITGWRPAWFVRSRSVSPRGEGERFRERLRMRMMGALEQCGGAWMPELHDETELDVALSAIPATSHRALLHRGGAPLAGTAMKGAVAIAVGPEGGIEEDELQTALGAGWRTAALETTTLRFETAVIAAAAVIRATQLIPGR